VTVADPRRYVRYDVRFAVELSTGGQLLQCEGLDLSAGGCRAVVLFPMQVGLLVRLRLRSERTPLEVSGGATVVWSTRSPPYQCGLQFSDPLAEQAVRLIHAMLGPVRLTKGGA
jgi:hypothetical protein